jgi:hypothetical protein
MPENWLDEVDPAFKCVKFSGKMQRRPYESFAPERMWPGAHAEATAAKVRAEQRVEELQTALDSAICDMGVFRKVPPPPPFLLLSPPPTPTL